MVENEWKWKIPHLEREDRTGAKPSPVTSRRADGRQGSREGRGRHRADLLDGVTPCLPRGGSQRLVSGCYARSSLAMMLWGDDPPA